MTDKPTQNDVAWELLFDDHAILSRIAAEGYFKISANQIKKYREPRLMAKFDHAINLPRVFTKHQLAILPISRGDYVISHFNAYHRFEPNTVAPITNFTLPHHLESLDTNHITSENIALNCAFAAGIIADFLEDEELFPTVSGRMGSGSFEFHILNAQTRQLAALKVDNAQLEIDAAYEGLESLTLFEAKPDLSKDFLVRQLYYPYRLWENRLQRKRVRSVFLIYSNGIYNLYEYAFQDPDNYNSLILVKQKNYSFENTEIDITDIVTVLEKVKLVKELEIPFPQANSFDRVINLCELLYKRDLSRSEVTQQYAFNVRQTKYYTDAARYLGLVERYKKDGSPYYNLSENARNLLNRPFKERQLEYCRRILQHRPFYYTLKLHLERGEMPSSDEIIAIMQASKLHNIEKYETFKRRSSTVQAWVNWILSLTHD